jgi:hypothetical protein
MNNFAEHVEEGMRVRSADGRVVGHAALKRGGLVVVKGAESSRDYVLRDDDVASVAGDEVLLSRSASDLSDDTGGDWTDSGAHFTDWESEGGSGRSEPSR